MTPCFPSFTTGLRLRSGVLAALAAGALLAGCFGGDDDAPPPATTAQAAADTAVAAWNTPTVIDVLANDSVSQGAQAQDKRLTAVARAPMNGTATIADGRISYRPRDGFYGSDTLRYAMASADGTATAEAEVAITVEAVLMLQGRAVDAPLAQAAVQISGAASAAATTDAQGAWQATVRVSDAAGVVHISATGTGAQAHVKLVGAAAASELAAAAAADGTVAAENVDALTVSHFSTALAALAERAHGRVPGTAQALAEARAKVGSEDLLNLATLIHMAADEGLALPQGKADTWALAQDAGAVKALLASQATADGAAFAAAQARAMGAVPAAGLLPTGGVLATYPAFAGGSGGALFTLRADGTAQVLTDLGEGAGRWTQEADGLVVLLDPPIAVTGYSSEADTVSPFGQLRIRTDHRGWRLKRLPGGLVGVSTAVTETVLDGSVAGRVTALSALSDPGTPHRLAVDPAAAAPLAAADFAVGRRWGGVVSRAGANVQFSLDLLEITGPGAGRGLIDGTTYQVQVAGAGFTLTGSDGSVRDYLRVGDAGAGASYFLVTERSPGAASMAQVRVLVPQAAALRFDAASAARTWQFGHLGPGTTSEPIVLRADGTGNYLGTGAASVSSWQVLQDGRLEIVRNRREQRVFVNGQVVPTLMQSRYNWILLGRGDDGATWVLRRLTFEPVAAPLVDNAPGSEWLVLRYVDTGPTN